MKKKSAKPGLVIAMLAAILYVASPASGCGPFFPEATFTFTAHPDFPLARYASGDLGILQPTYARSYLYVAYRYMTGNGFTPEEQNALLALWRDRLEGNWEFYSENENSKEAKPNEIQLWLDARAKIPGIGPAPKLESYNPLGITRPLPAATYGDYYNCLSDAFRTARNTLQGIVQQFGATSLGVRQWVQAQDTVFANCDSNSKGNGAFLPAAATAGDNLTIREDRAYQMAAAYFYAGDLGTAQAKFQEIASDSSSPWHAIASLVVARCLIRQATLGADNPELLQQAKAQLKTILGDAGENALHPAAQRLLGFVEARLNPEGRARELAQLLASKNPDPNLKQNLWDYTYLLDQFLGEGVYAPEQVAKIRAQNESTLSKLRTESDLTDWLLTFQDGSTNALEHANEKWQATHSEAWLAAALSKIPSDDPRVAELLAAAKRIPDKSPSFATASFHVARVLATAGKEEEARVELDSLLLHHLAAFPASSVNLLRALRMKLARNFQEFLEYAPRVPATVTSTVDDLQLPNDPKAMAGMFNAGEETKSPGNREAWFDVDAATILTQWLPLALLKQAVEDGALPENLRREVALAAWVRAVLLDDESLGTETTSIVQGLVPEMKADLDSYIAAPADTRRFVATLTMLRFPGLRPYVDSGLARSTPLGKIDEYRDNWWRTAWQPNWPEWRQEIPHPLQGLYAKGEIGSPSFLSGEQRTDAAKQWERLVALPAAPNYLCQQVLSWAKKHPDDPRIPEALHLAVRSTRYGMTDADTPKLSRAAFEFLHKHYPKNPWAQKTKYWF
jgi:hypothetical protein